MIQSTVASSLALATGDVSLASADSPRTKHAIEIENALPGTTEWQLDKTKMEFMATAARLELLRGKGVGTNAITIEETAKSLREIADRMGNHFRSAGIQINAILKILKL